MTGRISLHYEDEDCDEVVEMSFDNDCTADTYLERVMRFALAVGWQPDSIDDAIMQKSYEIAEFSEIDKVADELGVDLRMAAEGLAHDYQTGLEASEDAT